MYIYEEVKPKIFTEEGQVKFLKIRDKVSAMITVSGACTMGAAIDGALGDTWESMACVDRLLELSEVIEVKQKNEPAGQHRIFMKGY